MGTFLTKVLEITRDKQREREERNMKRAKEGITDAAKGGRTYHAIDKSDMNPEIMQWLTDEGFKVETKVTPPTERVPIEYTYYLVTWSDN